LNKSNTNEDSVIKITTRLSIELLRSRLLHVFGEKANLVLDIARTALRILNKTKTNEDFVTKVTLLIDNLLNY
jgi:hypothetical protein